MSRFIILICADINGSHAWGAAFLTGFFALANIFHPVASGAWLLVLWSAPAAFLILSSAGKYFIRRGWA